MATSYEYRGPNRAQVPVDNAPRLLSEQEIDFIIDSALAAIRVGGENDSVVARQFQEIAFSLRKDLRRIKVCRNVDLNRYIHHISARLIDAVLLVDERTGTIASSATTADIQQKVISEKRGGSGKNSGLGMVSKFEEMITASERRSESFAWVYPASASISQDELTLLKRDLIQVKLSEVMLSTRTTRYNELPEWYDLLDESPPQGYHFEIELNLVRMANRGVLVSQIISAIRGSLHPKMMNDVRFFASPYAIGRIDVFFMSALATLKATSNLGAQYIYAVKESVHVKGTPGVDWVIEKRVSPADCIQESQQLKDGRWITYFSLAPALRVCMGLRHLLQWLDGSGLQYSIDETSNLAFLTATDPRDQLKEWIEHPSSTELQLEIEYSGSRIVDFYRDRRFDTTRVMTNNLQANMEGLGVTGSRMFTAVEMLDLARNIVPDYDSRHSETIVDVMFSTGEPTGISVKGMELRGADAIQRLTFRQPEVVIRREARFALATENSTLTSSHFIGNPGAVTGSNLWRVTANPLAGVIGASASPDYIASIRGTRIPHPTESASSSAPRSSEADVVQLGQPARQVIRPGVISGRRVPTVVKRKITQPQ